MLRDGGCPRGEESTLSTVFSMQVHIAVTEAKGQKDTMAETKHVMDAIRAIGAALNRNVSVYATASEWVETAKLSDIPPSQEVWADVVEQGKGLPCVMATAVMEYKIYCQEV